MYLKLLQSCNRLHPRAWDFIQLMRLISPSAPICCCGRRCGHCDRRRRRPQREEPVHLHHRVILMRAAGCVVNDFADRNFDGHVQRTQARPMAAGRVSSREA